MKVVNLPDTLQLGQRCDCRPNIPSKGLHYRLKFKFILRNFVESGRQFDDVQPLNIFSDTASISERLELMGADLQTVAFTVNDDVSEARWFDDRIEDRTDKSQVFLINSIDNLERRCQ